MEALLGSSLQSSSGSVSTASLAGKYIGLYFSAHWCPPCRQFTPQLASTYKKVSAAGKPFEVVFVSADKSEAQFNEYFAEMPWLTIPFADRARVGELSSKFSIGGYPTLLILDPEGNVVTDEGRAAVSNDPDGESCPWIPPTIHEALGDTFLAGDGSSVGLDALEGKVIGLYFSAHWCGPCRGFTPHLASVYNAMQGDDSRPFEIVFVSSDRSQEQFDEYFGEMPWLALPYSLRKNKAALSGLFKVRGIPSLVILDANREVITVKGTGALRGDADGSDYPWYPKPLVNLAEDADGLNENPALVVLLDDMAADAAPLKAELEALAQEMKEQGGDILAFYATSSQGPVGRIRELTHQPKRRPHMCALQEADSAKVYGGRFGCDVCGKASVGTMFHCEEHGYDECPSCAAKSQKVKAAGVPDGGPVALILDIPDRGGYYLFSGGEVTGAALRDFVAAKRAGSLTRKQLG